jgi:hypothetical protein
LFAEHYARGLGSAQLYGDSIPEGLQDKRTIKAEEEYWEEIHKLYFAATRSPAPEADEEDWEEEFHELYFGATRSPSIADLTQQIKNTEEENPFFGVLPEIYLQRVKNAYSDAFRPPIPIHSGHPF